MDCPECNYALSSFDKECPRCKNFKAKGLPVTMPVPTKPEPVVAPVEYVPPAPRPMRNITPEPIVAAVNEPAPLIIYTNRVIEWKKWAALAAVIILVFGGAFWYQARQAAITKAIVLAARQGACERMSEFETDREVAGCTQLAGALNYNVVRDTPDHAQVTFFLNGAASSLQVVVNEDQDGDWHAVSAKEGDEGSRTPWEDRRFHDPAPAAAPAAQNPDAPVTLPSPDTSSSPAPSSDTGTSNASSDGSSYTMRTRAGGGSEPDSSVVTGR